ncbi:hypothetical protein GCM10009830_19890 [Glycomyces endophyticus]|uniref:Secreted protein n=1 Tax=Glycomyces endophyticus TaxID=480996 RepID=A0ABN2GM48_9ACTN
MRLRRLIAKAAIAWMVFGAGSVAAVMPASSASAAEAAGCTVTTSISGPNKVGSNVNGVLRITVSGCAGRYWTEYSYLNGPSNDARTVTYKGNRSYSVLLSAPCRNGTYRLILQIIGSGFDSYDEQAKTIRC